LRLRKTCAIGCARETAENAENLRDAFEGKVLEG